MNLFKENGTIVLAVKFDEHVDGLIRQAVSLCKRTNSRLKIIHICEPWVGRSWGHVIGTNLSVPQLSQSIEDQSLAKAQTQLTELVGKHDTKVPIEARVVKGDPAQGLIAEGVSSGASLLMTGIAPKLNKFMPVGFSTALSVMTRAPLPVLVLSPTKPVDFAKQPLKILLADDTADDTLSAVDFSFRLSEVAKNCELTHLHISGLTKETLRQSLEMAAASAHTAINPADSADEIFETTRRKIIEKLESRILDGAHSLEQAGGRYTIDLRHGVTGSELEKGIETCQPDIIVFGRHQTFHHRPFYMGQVPYTAMISSSRAVVVVPGY